ncbi:MAG: hypothetical protein WD226_13510 [Planctomycetota bacterium]
MSVFVAGFVVALVTAWLVTPVLARLSPRAWLDVPTASERARKPQLGGVPAVGGAAVLAAIGATVLVVRGFELPPVFVVRDAVGTGAALATLGLAALVGTFDDLRGLPPLAKVAAQLVVVLPIASVEQPELALGALVAMNLANTWDHHDGVLAGLGCAGFLGAGSGLWAGALAGFLPHNLNASKQAGAAPTAYLGDAGSHLVGAALVLVPGAAWALVLPALDLARLSIVRYRAGSRPWVGDRRHLAHLLARRVESRGAIAAITTLIALPAIAGGPEGGAPAGLGVVTTLLLYVAALRFARE